MLFFSVFVIKYIEITQFIFINFYKLKKYYYSFFFNVSHIYINIQI
jgi:hypothetical protein